MSHTQLPDYGAVLAEVREVRRAGIVRLRELGIPVLTGLSAGPGEGSPGGPHFPAVERLLRTAVASMGGGTLQEAAEYSLGLARGTRDWPPADRRRRAAQVYGVSVERFRKHHELMVLGQVAEQVVRHAGGPRPSAEPTTEEVGRQRPEPARGADWDIHLVVRSHERAQLVRELLGPPAAGTAAGGPTGGARPQ
ncbi:hypothetical protein [Streptomyces sp. NPDC054854]